jgi:hypothetical protein
MGLEKCFEIDCEIPERGLERDVLGLIRGYPTLFLRIVFGIDREMRKRLLRIVLGLIASLVVVLILILILKDKK